MIASRRPARCCMLHMIMLSKEAGARTGSYISQEPCSSGHRLSDPNGSDRSALSADALGNGSPSGRMQLRTPTVFAIVITCSCAMQRMSLCAAVAKWPNSADGCVIWTATWNHVAPSRERCIDTATAWYRKRGDQVNTTILQSACQTGSASSRSEPPQLNLKRAKKSVRVTAPSWSLTLSPPLPAWRKLAPPQTPTYFQLSFLLSSAIRLPSAYPYTPY